MTQESPKKQAKVVHPEKVMPFIAPGCEGIYDSRMLIDLFNCGSDKMQLNHGTIKPGKGLPGAAHEGHDEVYIVIKGHADLNLAGQHFALHPGSVVFIPGGTFHALTNASATEEFELITVWAGQPAKGANELYDLRKEQWGTTYREV